MTLRSTLQRQIIDFLLSLPNMDEANSQKAFIYSAGLDQKLQDQIHFGQPSAQFIPLLLTMLTRYGRLNDGRYAIEAILEVAKDFIGHDKQIYCDSLLQSFKESQIEEQEISSQTEQQSPVLHNLPQPDYTRFVGRDIEVKQVYNLLSPQHRSWVITIDGIGGIGKSALALEIADSYRHKYYQLPQEERFDAIIWTTAKQTILTGEKIVTRSQATYTLNEVYTTIAITLHRGDILRVYPNEQSNLIRQALTQQRTLLIIDNLETVDDEQVLTFIREVPNPTKVIVTTRHRLDVAYALRLVAMAEKESLELIHDAANSKNVIFTADECFRLYQRTGGIPLAILWSVAQMGFGYGVESVLAKLGQPQNDIVQFCFEKALEYIKNKPSQKLLTTLLFFPNDANRDALGYMAELSILDRDDGLVELEKLSLVNRNNSRFNLLPLTKILAKNFITIEEKCKLQQKYIQYFAEFCKQEIGTQYWDGLYYEVTQIEPDLENLCYAFNLAFESERWESAKSIFIGMVHPLSTSKTNAFKRIELSEKAIIVAGKLNDKEMLAWLHIDTLGFSYRLLGKINEALSHINVGRLIAQEMGLVDCLAMVELSLSRFAIERNETVVAFQHLENALSQAKSPLIKLRVYLNRASFYLREQNLQNAVESALLATTIATEIGDYLDEVGALVILGQSYLKLGEFASAEKTFLNSQQLSNKYGWSLSLGDSLLGLAELNYLRNDLQQASYYVKQTKNIYELIGRPDRIKKLNDIIAAIRPSDP